MHRSSCGDEKEREKPFASARRTQWFPIHDLSRPSTLATTFATKAWLGGSTVNRGSFDLADDAGTMLPPIEPTGNTAPPGS